MRRFAVAALAALFALVLLPAPVSGAGDACEDGPPGSHLHGDGIQVGQNVVNGMTIGPVRSSVSPNGGQYFLIDIVRDEIQVWNETNTWPGLQRGVDCQVLSGFLWADTLDQSIQF